MPFATQCSSSVMKTYHPSQPALEEAAYRQRRLQGEAELLGLLLIAVAGEERVAVALAEQAVRRLRVGLGQFRQIDVDPGEAAPVAVADLLQRIAEQGVMVAEDLRRFVEEARGVDLSEVERRAHVLRGEPLRDGLMLPGGRERAGVVDPAVELDRSRRLGILLGDRRGGGLRRLLHALQRFDLAQRREMAVDELAEIEHGLEPDDRPAAFRAALLCAGNRGCVLRDVTAVAASVYAHGRVLTPVVGWRGRTKALRSNSTPSSSPRSRGSSR